jgi:membrane protease YdiL (CAAX protease family)
VRVLWLAAGRSFPELGIGFGDGLGWWIGCGLTLAAGILLIMQTGSVLRSREKIQAVSDQIKPLRAMLPHDRREGRWFSGLSVTAGICEELLYRGFLMAYLTAAINIWAAVLASSIIFGLGHLYQGTTGIVKTAAIGLIMAGLYVLTGSLWLPMLLHALVDVNSGIMSRRVIEYMENPPDLPAE